MADLAVNFGAKVTLGAANSVCRVESVNEILRVALSFILPNKIMEKVFIDSKRVSVLESSTDEILEEVKVIGGKVDLLLDEAEASLAHFFRDAIIALKSENYQRAQKLFDLVYEYAVRAFNLSTKHESQLLTTRMKLTASYLSISCSESSVGVMICFNQLDPGRKKEIAETFKGYLDDLLDKTNEAISGDIKKLQKKMMVAEDARKSLALERVRGVRDSVSDLLKKIYPILSDGLGITNAIEPCDGDEVQFKVLLKYLPYGHHIRFPASILISSPKQGPIKLRMGKWEDFDKNERWLLFRIGDGAIYDCFLPEEAMESEQAAHFDLNTLQCRWKGSYYNINKSWV